MTLGLLTSLVSPAGERARLSVFYFHRTPECPDPMLPDEPDGARFERIVSWIVGQFRVLPPVEARERLVAGTLPSRAALITFDDGYRDNYTVALPILKRYGASAAFFVATGFLGGAAMFNDRIIESLRRCAAPSLDLGWLGLGTVSINGWAQRIVAADCVIRAVKHLAPRERDECVERLEWACGIRPSEGPMLRPDEVSALSRAGMEIGGHTRSHPVLVALPDGDARAEIAGCRDDLAALTGRRVTLFAYPNGRRQADYDERHVAMVRETGYAYAFSTEPGAASASSEPLELPRFSPWDRTRLRYGARALVNLLRSR